MIALGRDAGLFAGVVAARRLEPPVPEMLAHHPDAGRICLEVEFSRQVAELMTGDPGAHVMERSPGNAGREQVRVDMVALAIGEEPGRTGATPGIVPLRQIPFEQSGGFGQELVPERLVVLDISAAISITQRLWRPWP
jgi:hypothetical protein